MKRQPLSTGRWSAQRRADTSRSSGRLLLAFAGVLDPERCQKAPMQLCEHLRTVWTTDPPLLIDILAISKIAPRGFHHRLRNTHLAHGLKSLALAPVLNRLRERCSRRVDRRLSWARPNFTVAEVPANRWQPRQRGRRLPAQRRLPSVAK